jgi:hypothetical protein
MSPVIVAPYSLLYNGFLYLKGLEDSKDFFYKSRYSDWFEESGQRIGFDWFLNDVSLYFTGYPIDKNRKFKQDDFKGYRYNMVTWAYNDDPGWEEAARRHPGGTKYARTYRDAIAHGKFWDREASPYEAYRRDGGEEGYGGDNHYASCEIIRYIMMSLYQDNYPYPHPQPAKPYISIWTLALHLNAVTAFFELGYLRRPADRYILLRKQDEIAEGIAAGIYSLLAGMKPKNGVLRYPPKGKRIDLEKYRVSHERSYFDEVSAD